MTQSSRVRCIRGRRSVSDVGSNREARQERGGHALAVRCYHGAWPSTSARSSPKSRRPGPAAISARSAGVPASTASAGFAGRRRIGCRPGADEEDRAKFAKLRDYLLRLDDEVTCKTCGKKFEIPSQHSLVFADQLAGLPNDDELEKEIVEASGGPEPEPQPKPALPARFTRKSTGWK